LDEPNVKSQYHDAPKDDNQGMTFEEEDTLMQEGYNNSATSGSLDMLAEIVVQPSPN